MVTKIICTLFLSLLFIAFLPAVASASPYDYDGAWTSDSDSFALEAHNNFNKRSFGMYALDNQDNTWELFSGTSNSEDIYVWQDDGSWQAGFSQDSPNLNLGSSPEFGFYFQKENDQSLQYDLVREPGSNEYDIEPDFELKDQGAHVGVSGASPAPLPGAVWALGAGLAGLYAIRKKFA